jgi:hypothetical protein
MTIKGRAITLSLKEQDKLRLQQLAAELDITWGDKPNISKLLEAIAQNKLRVAANHDWHLDRINALNHARQVLTDTGDRSAALIITRLLLDRSELSFPLRAELEKFVADIKPPLRSKIDALIRKQQPFKLSYQDAAGKVSEFSIYHAHVVPHEQRLYLDVWCTETLGNSDIEALQHNWCLRLDRIPDESSIVEIKGKWRSRLDLVSVEFHLLNGLAFGYKSKTGADLENEWVQERTRRVVREVSSTFWFFREVLRYGEDCAILAPDEVLQKFRNKVKKMHELYEIQLL